jgi:uncharacterized repeat protein (TIGR04076 family)
MLEIKVHEIRGKCPVHRKGDRIIIEGSRIILDKTDALCIHALPSLLHYAVALDHGADPLKLGLTKPDDRKHAYIQCVDPYKPYTDGGTVIFKITKVIA